MAVRPAIPTVLPRMWTCPSDFPHSALNATERRDGLSSQPEPFNTETIDTFVTG